MIYLFPSNIIHLSQKKNKGSAIFLHLTKNYKSTLGCIALKEKDMIILLKIIIKKLKSRSVNFLVQKFLSLFLKMMTYLVASK